MRIKYFAQPTPYNGYFAVVRYYMGNGIARNSYVCGSHVFRTKQACIRAARAAVKSWQ